MYGVTFSYSEQIADLSTKVLLFKDGKSRLLLQNSNLKKIIPEIQKILDFEVKEKGKIVKVEWIGRNFVITQTTSDVDAHHNSGMKTRFSIKSIAGGGFGTIKNLGMRNIKKYLEIDFSLEMNKMWKELFDYIGVDGLTKARAKKKVNGSKRLLEWAKKNGKIYQRKLNRLSVEAFNSLTQDKKITFLNFILDSRDTHLYVVIANENGVSVYKPVDRQILGKDKICAKDGSGLGYVISINDIPTYRVQTNNTNGIGISAFCERVFAV